MKRIKIIIQKRNFSFYLTMKIQFTDTYDDNDANDVNDVNDEMNWNVYSEKKF